jgi:hypothetical protein
MRHLLNRIWSFVVALVLFVLLLAVGFVAEVAWWIGSWSGVRAWTSVILAILLIVLGSTIVIDGFRLLSGFVSEYIGELIGRNVADEDPEYPEPD